jgi:two-component system, cell cycle sensor histidine kinase and response regulator CckA
MFRIDHMEKPLRILYLEDEPDFAALISAMLEKEGLPVEIVCATNLPDFNAALKSPSSSYDVILADYLLPSCNGIQALEAARTQFPDIPFLLVSGTIGEQAAIESLRCGATDYVLKTRLERLAPALRRAVQESQDRSKRRHAETELVRREKYFRMLMQNSLDVLTILNREGKFEYNSPALKTVLGYDPAALTGRSAFELVHPDDLPALMLSFERTLRHPELKVTHQFRARRQDGSWCHLETICQSRLDDGEIAGVVVNGRDVTDRKRAEAGMHESEKQYQLIFNGNPVPMWVSDAEGRAFLAVNDAAIEHYGYSRDEFLAMTINDIRPSEEVEKLIKYFSEEAGKRSGGTLGRAGLWRHRKKDGTLIDAEITWSQVVFEGRTAILTIANDVTERKRSAEALQRSETSLAAAQRIAHLGSWELDLSNPDDLNSNELRWSNETYRIFGLEPQAATATNELFFKHVHPDDRQRITEAVSQALQKRQSYDLEHRIVRSSGEERMVRVRAEFAFDEGRPALMRGIIVDITERKLLEEKLRQSQKMEAIGQLAGGVAHDFNNILTVIHGHASLLLLGKTLNPAATRSATQIVQAADRAASLTRQLLTFSRRQVMQPRRLDLNEVVSNMTMMLGRILGEDIALQLNYWPQPACIQADASMIEQVLLNLAVNARDALPKGGKLILKIAVIEVNTERRLQFHPEARSGRFVCLSVVDNGSGIAPENLRRIFEPFFTTKEVGKGTGLGLATVYGIVKQHQGWVEVESEPGKGATFRVYLPMSTDATVAVQPHHTERVARGGSETILVVEDETPVRELVCGLLTGHGYRVLHAESGVKALELWRQSKEKVDLLLTDVVMPDRLNGRELAEKLRAEQPALKVIFTSGYSADVVGHDFTLQHGLHYLQKPYDPVKLAMAVRSCLDA